MHEHHRIGVNATTISVMRRTLNAGFGVKVAVMLSVYISQPGPTLTDALGRGNGTCGGRYVTSRGTTYGGTCQ